jgi:hypothetical protein
MRTITITIPDDHLPGEHDSTNAAWMTFVAAVDLARPGASRDCIERLHDGFRHPSLGITVRVA